MLRIIVPEALIMDGMVDIPQVGDHVDYALQFYRALPWMHPEVLNEVVARVELLNDGTFTGAQTDPYGHDHPDAYPMLLHGDGWSAYFLATHLHEGSSGLSGSFEADWPGVVPAEARVFGTVSRRQLITRTSRPNAEGQHIEGWTDTLGEVTDGHTRLRSGLVPETTVPPGQRGWVRVVPPRNGPWVREAGVLVDLEVAESW